MIFWSRCSSDLPMTVLLLAHLAAVLLAALAVWSIRHELSERATSRLAWPLPPALAAITAGILLVVSPGKRPELWIAAIAAGLAIGAAMGTTLKVNQDFGLKLVRVARTWDGAAAAALLLALALARFVTSNLMARPSGKFGVLAAAATLLAAYLAGRFIVVHFYKAPRSIHLDMVRGRNPGRTLVN